MFYMLLLLSFAMTFGAEKRQRSGEEGAPSAKIARSDIIRKEFGVLNENGRRLIKEAYMRDLRMSYIKEQINHWKSLSRIGPLTSMDAQELVWFEWERKRRKMQRKSDMEQQKEKNFDVENYKEYKALLTANGQEVQPDCCLVFLEEWKRQQEEWKKQKQRN